MSFWIEGLRKYLKMHSRTSRLNLLSGSGPVFLGLCLLASHGTSIAEETTPIEVIMVTATKRAENIQDVPISITAITGEEIDRRGLVNSADYLRGIPSVNQTEVPYGGQAIIIRGIETTTSFQSFGAGPATAVYFGETPITYTAGLLGSSVDVKLVDVERVEVLRGPQGTAFGSSSMGGAVRIIPVAPKLDVFEGKFVSNFSSTADSGGQNYMFQGVINIPLVDDRLAMRAAAYAFQNSGYYTNRAGSDTEFQENFVEPWEVEAYATDEKEVGSSYVTGARVSFLFQATDDLSLSLNYLTQENDIDGYAIATNRNYEQVYLRVAPEHVLRDEPTGVTDTNIGLLNLVVDYDLGWGNILGTYSYIDSGQDNSIPLTASDGIPASFIAPSPHTENSAEIRLTTNLDGAWNFLVGVFGEDQDDVYSTDWRWIGNPDLNFFAPGTTDLIDYEQKRNLKQIAAFAEATWDISPQFSFTGGARLYDYKRDTHTEQGGPLVGGTSSSSADTDANGTTFRANLNYTPSENVLIYGSWTEGFRLGSAQSPIPAGACDINGDGLIDGTNVPIESTGSVDSDEMDNYELGGKFSLLEDRLLVDAAVFRMDWSGLPVLVAPPECGFYYTTNAGEARSDGVELQTTFQVTDELLVDFGGSYIDARLTEDVPVQGWVDGDRLPASPEWTANLGVQQEFTIGKYPAFVRVDSIYVGSFYADVQQSPNGKSGDYVKVDARARIYVDQMYFDLYVQNLTNEDAFTLRTLTDDFEGFLLRPRTIGIEFGYNFGGL